MCGIFLAKKFLDLHAKIVLSYEEQNMAKPERKYLSQHFLVLLLFILNKQ